MLEKVLKELESFEKGEKVVSEYREINKRHEFLFFFKPEVFFDGVNVKRVFEITEEKFREFGIETSFISIVGFDKLKEIIPKHYGVINEIARKGIEALSREAREKFKEVFGEDIESATLLGAFQFLERYPFFNEASLDVLWENAGCKKLASGTYCARVKVFNDTVYILNGFHPNQILHYTKEGRKIVVVVGHSDASWKELRQDLIGATNPYDAKEGSLRRIFLEMKEELGLKEVSQGYNCVHLSAGPIEAIAEIVRFCNLPLEKLAMARRIIEVCGREKLERALENPVINGSKVFDLTEEVDVEEAIEVVKKL